MRGVCYNTTMASKILKEVLGRVETWPEERQDVAANLLIEMEQQDAYSVGLSDFS